jgi:hypothetical protein
MRINSLGLRSESRAESEPEPPVTRSQQVDRWEGAFRAGASLNLLPDRTLFKLWCRERSSFNGLSERESDADMNPPRRCERMEGNSLN